MVAQQQRKTDLAAKFIQQVRAEPEWFLREVLNHRPMDGEPSLAQDPRRSWELDKFQVDLAEAVMDVWRKKQGIATRINHDGRPYITVRAGHGPGKTHLAALIAHLFATAFPARIICTAPKLQQLRTRLWGALRKIDARAEAWWRTTHVIHDTAVYWMRQDPRGRMVEDRNWCILAETATQPENLAGHHERFQLVIVDEATGVSENIYPVIFGALSSGELQVLLMISNPTKITGTFAASHLKASEAANYFRYHISLENARRIERPWVASMERKYGKNSPVVKVRCHGEFVSADERQLIALEWIEAARTREVKSDGSLPRLRISVDCAAGGEDESIVSAMRHHDACRHGLQMKRYSFNLADATVRTADAAESMFREWSGAKDRDDFVVDALGVGVGVAGLLRARGYRVVFYQGGASSDSPTLWRNRRVQSYLGLRNDLRDGTLAFRDDFLADTTDWDDFDAQLCSIRTADAERLEDLEPKNQMLISPDMADAMAMQYATMAPQAMTAVMRDPTAPLPAETVVMNSSVNKGLEGW